MDSAKYYMPRQQHSIQTTLRWDCAIFYTPKEYDLAMAILQGRNRVRLLNPNAYSFWVHTSLLRWGRFTTYVLRHIIKHKNCRCINFRSEVQYQINNNQGQKNCLVKEKTPHYTKRLYDYDSALSRPWVDSSRTAANLLNNLAYVYLNTGESYCHE